MAPKHYFFKAKDCEKNLFYPWAVTPILIGQQASFKIRYTGKVVPRNETEVSDGYEGICKKIAIWASTPLIDKSLVYTYSGTPSSLYVRY